MFTLLVLTGLLYGNASFAHMLNMTNINVQVDDEGEARLSLRIDLGQSLMSAAEYWAASQAEPDLQAQLLKPALLQLEREMVFLVDEQPVQPELTQVELSARTLAAIQNPLTPQMATLTYRIQLADASRLQVQLADDLQIPWPCLLTVEVAGHSLPQSRLLTEVDRVSRIASLGSNDQQFTDRAASLASRWATVAPELTWVAVGFQHIVPEGLDHILFILGLFFLAGGWRPLLVQVTAFTVAHSITLGLSSYGLIHVPANIVEPLIALSIVYVAVDNLFATQLARWRIFVVCAFGLLHGLGFASVLSNIGLPEEQFLLSLGLFNLGVELGQLAVIAAAFLIVGWFRRQSWYQSIIAQPATVAIAGTGAYWFLKRIAFT